MIRMNPKISMPTVYVKMLEYETLIEKETEMTSINKVKGGGNSFSFDLYGSDRKDDEIKSR
jgi:hypothetical protein